MLHLQPAAEDRRVVVARVGGAVAPGGTLLFVAHDVASLDGGHCGPQRAEVPSTPEGGVADLPDLEVVRAERIRRRVALPDGGEATAIDTLARARRPA